MKIDEAVSILRARTTHGVALRRICLKMLCQPLK